MTEKNSIYMKKLQDAHEKMLTSWKTLLTGHPNEASLQLAFRQALQDYPDAVKKVCGPNATHNMISLAAPILFPKLSATAPKIPERIIEALIDGIIKSSKAELITIAGERNLETKFLELEELIRNAKNETKETRPAPLEVMPEDEVRSLSMDIKNSYLKQLESALEKLSRENTDLETDVMNMDARAKAIKTNIDSKMAEISKIATLASESIPT